MLPPLLFHLSLVDSLNYSFCCWYSGRQQLFGELVMMLRKILSHTISKHIDFSINIPVICI